MSLPLALAPTANRRIGRSITALAVAFLANAVLSLAVDQLLHVLGVYPPWGQPMYSPGLNLLALSYRLVLGVAAGYVVARLAPHAPVRHANILGAIGTVLATIGAAVGITQADLGPSWYPIALAVLAYPTIWLGAAWYLRGARSGRH